MHLRAKLLSMLVPLLLLPLLGLAWVAYTQLHEQAEEKAGREMQSLLSQLELHTQALLTTTQANLELFANSGQLQSYLLNPSESDRFLLLQPSLLRLFSSYQDAYPEYYEVRIVMPDGFEDTRAVRGVPDNVTEYETQTALFRQLQQTGDHVVLQFAENPDDGRFVLYAAKPILLRDAAVDPILSKPLLRGYLILTVALDSLTERLAASDIGAQGYMFAIDGAGTVRVHADKARLGTRLSDDILAGLNRLTDPGQKYVGELDDKVVHYQTAGLHNNLRLVSAYPESSFRAAGRVLAEVLTGITLLALVVMLTFAYWFMNVFFIRPVQKLRAATRQVGEGNLRVELDVSSNDEIGDLARAFSEMGESLHESQEQIRFHAYHDNLTSLPNRFMLREYLEHAVGRAKRYHETLGVLFADVDGFKRVNDTLGHHAGDELLRQISERISKVVRQDDVLGRPGDEAVNEDVVSRIGGDEFVVLINQMNYSVEAGKVAQRIIDVIGKPFTVAGQEIYVGISIGVALYPTDAEDADDLLKHADIAMFHAKAAGKNNFQFYSSAMNAVAINKLALEANLHRAMESDELFLVYQPKIDLLSGRTIGVEALLRWQHPEEGMIPPSVFIPVAEEVGLINALGDWIMQTACQQIRDWQTGVCRDLVVAVNISSQQIVNPVFFTRVREILQSTDISPERLDFELTETSIMLMESTVDEVFAQIHALGITISLDDFGTGYSSLTHLRRFPIDSLKIDRSFVDEALTNPDDKAIVSAIIGMAKNLGLRVTAEGVEVSGQADFIRNLGCDYAQGYYFGRPMTADQIQARLEAECDAARQLPLLAGQGA